MHIPDGYLSAKVCLAGYALAGAGLAWAAHQLAKSEMRQHLPAMGLSAVFIFAAQTVHFPAAPGTSGHLFGGLLAALLLGPSPAVLAMASVVTVQALLFHDGGVAALGANLLNLAIIAPLSGYFIFTRLRRRFSGGAGGYFFSAALASWASILLASIACSIGLAISGRASAQSVLASMAQVHALIGIGEAAITGLILALAVKVQPDLSDPSPAGRCPLSRQLSCGAIIAIAFALLISPLGVAWPDGLEAVAQILAF